jgi:ketosteroid isomerase-like protein
MSSDNVESARRAYAAFNRRDPDAFLALVDPEVEFSTRFVERSDPYHGHDGVRAWWDDILRVFPDFSVEVVEILDMGDVTVNALRVRGHGLGSDTPFEESIWQVAEWRAGKAISWHSHATEAEALEAAESRGQD